MIFSGTGRRIVLPTSFIGGPRDMKARFQDAMALVQTMGKPDLFITVTCNPDWTEIRNNLLPGQSAQDRPDMVTRVFNARLKKICDEIYKDGIYGKTVGRTHVIEFQKRGLPHAHILVILESRYVPRTTEDIDQIVRAEIPNQATEPYLYQAVSKHMIHGPCGPYNTNAPCMVNGVCSKKYPKAFCPETVINENSYPLYRRRHNGPTIQRGNNNLIIDNHWVVPYSPYLSAKYQCHINVEICAEISAVKYLYKYVYKGHDKVVLDVGENIDEVNRFRDSRWVAAPEACWRIFSFKLSATYPSVIRLDIHLPDQHQVTFSQDEQLEDVIERGAEAKTMLTGYFARNRIDANARRLKYAEFPQHYTWHPKTKEWKPRQRGCSIGRIYAVYPSDPETWYLRLLLNHVTGATSFEHLRTFHGRIYESFRSAALARGLLENDHYLEATMAEAYESMMPSYLRRLFGILLATCQPSDPLRLWNFSYRYMTEDWIHQGCQDDALMTNQIIEVINPILLQNGLQRVDLSFPDLPRYDPSVGSNQMNRNWMLDEERESFNVDQVQVNNVNQLNNQQRSAFDQIINACYSEQPACFFIDGPGGSGKTFLYNCLLENVRSTQRIAIACAGSGESHFPSFISSAHPILIFYHSEFAGIAAMNMPYGRTAHLTFGIPPKLLHNSVSSIAKHSQKADVLRQSKLIIWDEAPMTHRHALELVDRLLQDLMDSEQPFGGKVIVLGGDFRQVLPVVRKGSRPQIVDASIVNSYCWRYFQQNIIRLSVNMRAAGDPAFQQFLLSIGNGDGITQSNNKIKLPTSMVIHGGSEEQNLDHLIAAIFPNISTSFSDPQYFLDRAILCCKNISVNQINSRILGYIPSQGRTYTSFDSVEDDPQNLYLQEYINGLTISGFPPHILELKRGVPIIMLRNLDRTMGLCNGTRLIVENLGQNVIHARVISGNRVNHLVAIPRIPFISDPDESGLPFKLIRKQFPVNLAFSLTINKSQGQTIGNVGIALHDPVFSHGQLYVALSRSKSSHTTKVVISQPENGQASYETSNIVYKEVLSRVQRF